MKNVSNDLNQLTNKVKIALFILFLILGYSSKEQVFKPDLKAYKLKGKVKSINVKNYLPEERNGKITKGKQIRAAYMLFNEKGNIIEFGDETGKDTYKYDQNGYLSELILNRKDAGPFKKYTYKFDNRGKQIESATYDSLGSMNTENTFQYNGEGYVTQWNQLNPNGSLDQKVMYKNDQRGNQVEADYYNSDGSLSSKNTFKYDDRGNQIESNSYNPTGSILNKYSRKYDDKGNVIEVRLYNPGGNYTKTTWKHTFDAYNNIVGDVVSVNDKPTQISEIVIEYYK